MGLTLNKDGTPRKVGSGKTKGAGCFAKIKWQQLREFIGEDEQIPVSRVWLRSVGALSQKKGSSKKTYPKRAITKTPPHTPPETPNKINAISSPSNTLAGKTSPSDSTSRSTDEDDYSPPVFAIPGKISEY